MAEQCYLLLLKYPLGINALFRCPYLEFAILPRIWYLFGVINDLVHEALFHGFLFRIVLQDVFHAKSMLCGLRLFGDTVALDAKFVTGFVRVAKGYFLQGHAFVVAGVRRGLVEDGGRLNAGNVAVA